MRTCDLTKRIKKIIKKNNYNITIKTETVKNLVNLTFETESELPKQYHQTQLEVDKNHFKESYLEPLVNMANYLLEEQKTQLKEELKKEGFELEDELEDECND